MQYLRRVVPQCIRQKLRELLQLFGQVIRARRSPKQVFAKIYRERQWGGELGELCSGAGSTQERIVGPYVDMVAELSSRFGWMDKTFVDLGCGDFRVGKRLQPFCQRYIGVDVVEDVVSRNQAEFASQKAVFKVLDIVADELPPGDVCFVRQVLQHLSNKQIGCILKKLGRYRWVVISEHYPSAEDFVAPNLDKVHGGDVRAVFGSGVYLEEPPFSLPRDRMECLLEVPGAGLGDQRSQGVVRTILYMPR